MHPTGPRMRLALFFAMLVTVALGVFGEFGCAQAPAIAQEAVTVAGDVCKLVSQDDPAAPAWVQVACAVEGVAGPIVVSLPWQSWTSAQGQTTAQMKARMAAKRAKQGRLDLPPTKEPIAVPSPGAAKFLAAPGISSWSTIDALARTSDGTLDVNGLMPFGPFGPEPEDFR